jgi:hypothetical protein
MGYTLGAKYSLQRNLRGTRGCKVVCLKALAARVFSVKELGGVANWIVLRVHGGEQRSGGDFISRHDDIVRHMQEITCKSRAKIVRIETGV